MRKTRFAILVAAAMAVAVPPLPVAAQPAPATLRLTASSEVRAVPDMAVIGAGVVSNAADAAAALADNGARMARVLAALRQAGIESRHIRTESLRVQPQYRYPQNEAPELAGFEASNRVEVRLRDVQQVGAVVDALVAAGGDRIDGPQFAVADPEPLLDEARAAAVRLARHRAEIYAGAAGLAVGRIVSIAEGVAGPPPAPAPRLMAMAAEATPVAAGELTLAASVTVEFELQPR